MDVVAAADDDVLGAPDDVEEPVLVEEREVARVQPAVAPRGRGRGRVVEVLALTPRVAHDEFADGTRRQLVARYLVDDAELGRRHRLAHGTNALVALLFG